MSIRKVGEGPRALLLAQNTHQHLAVVHQDFRIPRGKPLVWPLRMDPNVIDFSRNSKKLTATACNLKKVVWFNHLRNFTRQQIPVGVRPFSHPKSVKTWVISCSLPRKTSRFVIWRTGLLFWVVILWLRVMWMCLISVNVCYHVQIGVVRRREAEIDVVSRHRQLAAAAEDQTVAMRRLKINQISISGRYIGPSDLMSWSSQDTNRLGQLLFWNWWHNFQGTSRSGEFLHVQLWSKHGSSIPFHSTKIKEPIKCNWHQLVAVVLRRETFRFPNGSVVRVEYSKSYLEIEIIRKILSGPKRTRIYGDNKKLTVCLDWKLFPLIT